MKLRASVFFKRPSAENQDQLGTPHGANSSQLTTPKQNKVFFGMIKEKLQNTVISQIHQKYGMVH
jgi:hypothetical protein